jgi:hypothetical protein
MNLSEIPEIVKKEKILFGKNIELNESLEVISIFYKSDEYIVQSNKKALQGEKIETPTFIKEKGLHLDYSFYITNQIMKPLLQLFGLVLEDIWRMQNKTTKISKFRREIAELRREQEDNKKFEDKLAKMKDKEVKTLIFDKYLRETNNAKDGNQSVAKFFAKK